MAFVAACLVGGGALAIKGLGLESSLGMDSLWRSAPLDTPANYKVEMSQEEIDARVLAATTLTKISPAPRRTILPLMLPSTGGEIRVPDNARAGRSPSTSSGSRTTGARNSSYDKAPDKAFDLARRNPINKALSKRDYKSTGFKYTSESRRRSDATVKKSRVIRR